MWGYRFGYTAAQIELAVSDAPFVSYHHDKEKKKFKKADALSVLEAQRKWEQRQNERSGAKKRFSMNDYKQQN